MLYCGGDRRRVEGKSRRFSNLFCFCARRQEKRRRREGRKREKPVTNECTRKKGVQKEQEQVVDNNNTLYLYLYLYLYLGRSILA
jgi:hypothetical protein